MATKTGKGAGGSSSAPRRESAGEPRMVRVRALRYGSYRGHLIPPGRVFTVPENKIGKWMERVSDATPDEHAALIKAARTTPTLGRPTAGQPVRQVPGAAPLAEPLAEGPTGDFDPLADPK